MKPILALITAGLVAACGAGGPVAVDRVITDVQRDGTTITGTYNPAGFTPSEVRSLVANVCNSGGLSGYSEQPAETQVNFAFSCANGNSYGASAGINFTRTGANTATFSAVFSQNGNLTSASGNVTF